MTTRTTFRAVTEHQNWRSKDGRFIRTSQSHDEARPFTHVVLVSRKFDDDRGTCWFAESWAGSLVLAEKAADQYRRWQMSPTTNILQIVIVPVEIVTKERH
jgi:hypothetical protein